jgi:hypothetical protein
MRLGMQLGKRPGIRQWVRRWGVATVAGLTLAAVLVIGGSGTGANSYVGVRSTAASQNWSGYHVAPSVPARSVYAEWRVPNPGAAPGTTPTRASVWAGIGGFQGTTLVQAGSESEAYCDVLLIFCSAQHVRTYLWYEIYPDVIELPITSVPVAPGDFVSSTVSYSNGVATFVVCNRTRGRCATVHRRPSGPPSGDAEWVVERPTADGQVSMLADFGSVLIGRPRYTDARGVTRYAGVGETIDMYSCFGAPLAHTSPYSPRSLRFAVTWQGYGSVGC